jgi:tripartite-type tricarboxylate transporter receptor subunit TctC
MADDGYQKMTVREFRVMVNERLAERRAVGQKLENLAEDGTALEVEVNKRLYSGIPGLTDAIVNTVNNLYDQAAALNEVTRRLEERVLFGDSEAALEMLRRFEKDEVEVSEEIRAEFRKALETLKVSKKQLKGKK